MGGMTGHDPAVRSAGPNCNTFPVIDSATTE